MITPAIGKISVIDVYSNIYIWHHSMHATALDCLLLLQLLPVVSTSIITATNSMIIIANATVTATTSNVTDAVTVSSTIATYTTATITSSGFTAIVVISDTTATVKD